MSGNLKAYYILTKPGIVRGNALTAIAGYLFATKFHMHFPTFIAMLTGLSMIIACGCVYNNYLDRDIDSKMARTKKRGLVTGHISVRNALVFGTALGVLGSIILVKYTNELTAYVALFGLWAYVVLYGYGKRMSVHGTLIGSISGAIPPVVGYVAATNRIDTAAVLLFIILVSWQMPHFYAIAMYRAKDYAAAKIPVLPVSKGMLAAKRQTLAYIISFIIASLLLTIYGYTGYIYAVIMTLLGILWFHRGIKLFNTVDDEKWGKKMFLFSLVIISAASLMIPLGTVLP